MQTSSGYALREVRQAFGHTIEQMQRMHTDCQVKPSDVNVIQPVGEAGEVKLQCKPVVCRVPERASHGTASLYVVFTGSVTLSPERYDGKLHTTTYQTNFAYFAVEGEIATHVFGGHYDYSPSDVAHPRAHLQLRSQSDLFLEAQCQFRSIAEVDLTVDAMARVLTRVRPPSAQMDFLSFLVQICADHLVDKNSTPKVKTTFNSLAASCSPLFGYHAGVDEGCECHRGQHWYVCDQSTDNPTHAAESGG